MTTRQGPDNNYSLPYTNCSDEQQNNKTKRAFSLTGCAINDLKTTCRLPATPRCLPVFGGD